MEIFYGFQSQFVIRNRLSFASDSSVGHYDLVWS